MECADSVGGGFLDRIGNCHQPRDFSVNGNKHGRLALGTQRVGAFSQTFD